ATPTPSPTSGGALDRSGWQVSASSSSDSDVPANAIDGDPGTRWSTGASQTNGQWFQIDLGSTQSFNKIVLDATNSSNDYPASYEVDVSNDGSNWSSVATGNGSTVTTITFGTQSARYIKIVQTGSSSWWWSIHELNVYAP
ncbi:MAG TPA: discoidin domain-containing protein, partial [Ktedonobacteraceae bacterium]|nr:discoidin domain-containing protein [Ktedonobacteraceae bacterium]